MEDKDESKDIDESMNDFIESLDKDEEPSCSIDNEECEACGS